MRPTPQPGRHSPSRHGVHRGGPLDGSPTRESSDRIWTGTVYISEGAANALAAAPIPPQTIERFVQVLAAIIDDEQAEAGSPQDDNARQRHRDDER